MSSWNDLFEEINAAGSTYDIIRRKKIEELSQLTERNVIIYYSGWLNKPDYFTDTIVNDNDKNGFMTTIKGLQRNKGLDLILHTQGGDTAATESLVDYLKTCFDDIRAIIPQIAMSAGTMIACACKSIVMGKQSSLGPIDPQIQGTAAHGIIEEFTRAINEVKADPATAPLWQVIVSKYNAALIGDCKKAIDWSEEMVRKWLSEGMLKGEKPDKIEQVIKDLSDHSLTKSHGRHLSAQRCKEIGLKIEMMESNQKLQDAVLAVHHSTMLTLAQTPAIKIIENQDGKAFVQTANPTRSS